MKMSQDANTPKGAFASVHRWPLPHRFPFCKPPTSLSASSPCLTCFTCKPSLFPVTPPSFRHPPAPQALRPFLTLSTAYALWQTLSAGGTHRRHEGRLLNWMADVKLDPGREVTCPKRQKKRQFLSRRKESAQKGTPALLFPSPVYTSEVTHPRHAPTSTCARAHVCLYSLARASDHRNAQANTQARGRGPLQE